MKYLFVACLLCLSVLSAVAKVPAMNKIRLTNNWEYLKGPSARTPKVKA